MPRKADWPPKIVPRRDAQTPVLYRPNLPPDTLAATNQVLDLCAKGRAALEQAASVEEGLSVVQSVKVLESVVKVRKDCADAVIAASALRVRAERRLGQLLEEGRETGEIAKREDNLKRGISKGQSPELDSDEFGKKKLSDLGITFDQSATAARLAHVPEPEFEHALSAVQEEARDAGTNVTPKQVLRTIDPSTAKSPPERKQDAMAFMRLAGQLADLAPAALAAVNFGGYPALPLVTESDRINLTKARQAIASMESALDRRDRNAG